MKKIALLLAAVLAAGVVLPACGIDHTDPMPASSVPEVSSSIIFSTASTSDQSGSVLLAHDTLQGYLKDMWGYRENDHEYVFDSTIVIDGIGLYVFDIFHKSGEFDTRFAISVKEQVVYIYDTNLQTWARDDNPEPWPGW